MATFANEYAERQQVYVRRLLAGGNVKLERLPWDYVKYDDGSDWFVEPIASLGLCDTNKTWLDAYPIGSAHTFLIVDSPPFSGVAEFR